MWISLVSHTALMWITPERNKMVWTHCCLCLHMKNNYLKNVAIPNESQSTQWLWNADGADSVCVCVCVCECVYFPACMCVCVWTAGSIAGLKAHRLFFRESLRQVNQGLCVRTVFAKVGALQRKLPQSYSYLFVQLTHQNISFHMNDKEWYRITQHNVC